KKPGYVATAAAEVLQRSFDSLSLIAFDPVIRLQFSIAILQHGSEEAIAERVKGHHMRESRHPMSPQPFLKLLPQRCSRRSVKRQDEGVLKRFSSADFRNDPVYD